MIRLKQKFLVFLYKKRKEVLMLKHTLHIELLTGYSFLLEYEIILSYKAEKFALYFIVAG